MNYPLVIIAFCLAYAWVQFMISWHIRWVKKVKKEGGIE